jgi:hypothetical protein
MLRPKPLERITDRKKTNKGNHSREEKDGKEEGCMGNSHMTWAKNWSIMSSHIDG